MSGVVRPMSVVARCVLIWQTKASRCTVSAAELEVQRRELSASVEDMRRQFGHWSTVKDTTLSDLQGATQWVHGLEGEVCRLSVDLGQLRLRRAAAEVQLQALLSEVSRATSGCLAVQVEGERVWRMNRHAVARAVLERWGWGTMHWDRTVGDMLGRWQRSALRHARAMSLQTSALVAVSSPLAVHKLETSRVKHDSPSVLLQQAHIRVLASMQEATREISAFECADSPNVIAPHSL
eukprot:TRINITY_DN22771_c0_g1_i3.p1 TRINITY_DN22771_c0_g1~~TRINITY_DN22771_c0_g1_i3.p1  ORF type:complete len:237 (-),score=20.86 TRINITY_DN22771_c0_g1_i3:389-1099(-)